MSSIHPSVDQIPGIRPPSPSQVIEISRCNIISLFSYFYFLISLGCTFGYIKLLTENTTNDFLWYQYNISGAHIYLMDLFNQNMIYGKKGNINLFDSSMSIYKDYSKSTTKSDLRPIITRRFMLDRISLDNAIVSIRQTSFNDNSQIVSPYCWVDFNKSFELGHTLKRQEKCNKNYKYNGAMYLEGLFRNVNNKDLMGTNSFLINTTIFIPMSTLPGGNEWIEYILYHNWLSISNEINYWKNYNITFYQIQLQNFAEFSLSTTISIRNSIGTEQNITTSKFTYTQRSAQAWTTAAAYTNLNNDMWLFSIVECSLVRNTINHPDVLELNWDYVVWSSDENIPLHLLRNNIGPLQSIDIYFITIPNLFLNFIKNFHDELYLKLNKNKIKFPINTLIDPIPKLWKNENYFYYSGNPLCITNLPAMKSIRETFNYYDDCTVSIPFLILFEWETLLFSFYMNKNYLNICDLTNEKKKECIKIINEINIIYNELKLNNNNETYNFYNELNNLNISIMQYITDLNQPILLKKYLIDDLDDPWSFYGWIMLYEWAQALREVYIFSGDINNITIISSRVEFIKKDPNPFELPIQGSTYLWFSVVYVSFILFLVAFLQYFLSLLKKQNFYLHGNIFFHWFRVVGSVWIGRPFMFIRGLVAIGILSTAPVSFLSTNGFSYFQRENRNFFSQILFLSETIWFNYACIDFTLPWAEKLSRWYAPCSAFLSFFGIFLIDYIAPIHLQANQDLNCIIQSTTSGLTCFLGKIQIGYTSRIAIISSVHIISIIISFFIFKSRGLKYCELDSHALVPGASRGFFTTNDWHRIVVPCTMSGLFLFRSGSFDIKTWSWCDMTMLHRTIIPKLPRRSSTSTMEISNWKKYWRYFVVVISLGYMISSVISGYIFIVMTQSAMENDFWWAGFDTEFHLYLCNWFNINLQFPITGNIKLDQIKYSKLVSTSNTTTKVLTSTPLYASFLQDEINTIPNVIHGLREMNGCDIPWIMSSYCYVDFAQRWEISNSQLGQIRCKDELENGAVYMETFLRNSNWNELMYCWEDGLNIGFLNDILNEIDGIEWYNSLKNKISIENEIIYWNLHGIKRYTTQWQNYKKLGMIETFSIENAFGLVYPLKLKSKNSTFQLTAQTSMKMYWSLAYDLLTVLNNFTTMGGKSLIRSSSNYAFQNNTILENIMYETNILMNPLGPGLTLVRDILGPFGTIKIKRISPPIILQQLYREIHEELMIYLNLNEKIQKSFWKIYETYSFAPKPIQWDGYSLRGGDIFCELEITYDMETPLTYFSSTGVCGTSMFEVFEGNTLDMACALIAHRNEFKLDEICQRDSLDPLSCIQQLNQTIIFLSNFKTNIDTNAIQAYLRDVLKLSLQQYLTEFGSSSDFLLSIVNIFDPNEIEFEFFAWLTVFQWVQGTREVITLINANGTEYTLLSGSIVLDSTSINSMEIPRNVAFLIRSILVYITSVLVFVACLICFHIIFSHGNIEGYNIFSFNRVSGMVWIGRPLVIIRAIAGIAFLSTPQPFLSRSNYGITYYMESATHKWYTTILSAGEVCWFVYAINDTFSVVTLHHTYWYSFTSSTIVWFTAGLWNIISPPHQSLILNRQCKIESVDNQFLCHSGILILGNFIRFSCLLILVFGTNLICYLIEKYRLKNRPPIIQDESSAFLYASAKWQFFCTRWQYKGFHYLDISSSFMNGIIPIIMDQKQYMLDIKSWRIHVHTRPDTPNLPNHLKKSIVLLE